MNELLVGYAPYRQSNKISPLGATACMRSVSTTIAFNVDHGLIGTSTH
jgi:hypothetical protein